MTAFAFGQFLKCFGNVARTLCRLPRGLSDRRAGSRPYRDADPRQQHPARYARRPAQHAGHAGRSRHHDRRGGHRAHLSDRGDGSLVRLASPRRRRVPDLARLEDDPRERRRRRAGGQAAARRIPHAGRAGGAQQSQDADLLRRLLPAIHRSGARSRPADPDHGPDGDAGRGRYPTASTPSPPAAPAGRFPPSECACCRA